ncbi:MAG: LLM class oxidoreductase [Pseudomonadota bacterium]
MGFNATFKPDQLSVGLVVPIESYATSTTPTMENHIQIAQKADALSFAALWLRDVPFNVPSFGDAGQMFDPFVYLGTLAAVTQNIALGTGSIILPLRHPAHVAKAAASADVLSNGRLILGVASGDRPEEYPAMNMEFDTRGARFRDSYAYIRAMAETFPHFKTDQGESFSAMDMLPKPTAGKIPMLITGGSRQDPQWVAENSDGWITYPRSAAQQAAVITDYRTRIANAGLTNKPVMQSLYIDLLDDADAPARPIHLGFQSGITFLRSYLQEIQSIGVNHVAINLRFNQNTIDKTLQTLADQLLPDFPTERD